MSVLFYYKGNGTQAFVDPSLGNVTIGTPGTGSATTKAVYPRIYNAFAANAHVYAFENDFPLGLTHEFWFRSTAHDTTSARVLMMPSAGTDSKKIQMQYSENTSTGIITRLYMEDRNVSSNIGNDVSSLNLNARDWHHISYVHDYTQGEASLFIDGIYFASASLNSNNYQWNTIAIAGKTTTTSSASEYAYIDICEVVIASGAMREKNVNFVPPKTYAVNTYDMLEVGTPSDLNVMTPGGINTDVAEIATQLASKANRNLDNLVAQTRQAVTLLFGGGTTAAESVDITLTDKWSNYDLICFTYSKTSEAIIGNPTNSYIDSKIYPSHFIRQVMEGGGGLALFGYASRYSKFQVLDEYTFKWINQGSNEKISVIAVYGINLNVGIPAVGS